MAYNRFYGWSEADLLIELANAQSDLSRGKTANDVQDSVGTRIRSAVHTRPEVRIELIGKALYRINPTQYADLIGRVTSARVTFGVNTSAESDPVYIMTGPNQNPDVRAGTITIPNGANSGTVTGLGLPWTPTKVEAHVRKITGTLDLFANVVGAPTADGFSYTLNGVTDTADYKLDYDIFH